MAAHQLSTTSQHSIDSSHRPVDMVPHNSRDLSDSVRFSPFSQHQPSVHQVSFRSQHCEVALSHMPVEAHPHAVAESSDEL